MNRKHENTRLLESMCVATEGRWQSASSLYDGVKILGNGSIEKKINIKANAFSESAKKKIESVGGTCEII